VNPDNTSTATAQGLYACAGTGTTNPALFTFTVSGILDFENGTTVSSPPGSLWTWDVFGINLINITVTNGTWSATPNGQGNLTLFFTPPPPPQAGLIPLSFTNNVVMSNIDSAGVAHTLALTFQAPPTFVDFTSLTICQALSVAAGNPHP
jgi:hypothetical protein